MARTHQKTHRRKTDPPTCKMRQDEYEKAMLNGNIVKAACEMWWWGKFGRSMPPTDYCHVQY